MAIVEPGAPMQGMNVPQPTGENQGIGNGAPVAPLNREDNFAKAFGGGIGPDSAEPGVPPQPPQAMTQGTPTGSSDGNLTGATDLASRLGVVSQSMGESSVLAGPTSNPLAQGPDAPKDVSTVLLEEVKQEQSMGNQAAAANVGGAVTSEAVVSQPVAPGITPDMTGLMGESQIPAGPDQAAGESTTSNRSERIPYNELVMSLLKEASKGLKSSVDKIDQAMGEMSKSGAEPTDPLNASPTASDSVKEPVRTT